MSDYKYKVVFVSRDREDLYVNADEFEKKDVVINFLVGPAGSVGREAVCVLPIDKILYVIDQSRGQGGGEKD